MNNLSRLIALRSISKAGGFGESYVDSCTIVYTNPMRGSRACRHDRQYIPAVIVCSRRGQKSPARSGPLCSGYCSLRSGAQPLIDALGCLRSLRARWRLMG
jgi:hypothetical protein